MSVVTERRVKILMILIKAEGFVKLDSLMERISGAGKSTIRSDLEYLAEYFPIESKPVSMADTALQTIHRFSGSKRRQSVCFGKSAVI